MAFQRGSEKSHVETPPHTYFDISLTDVIFNHRLGGKTRNVMCLPAIGVMELAGSPTIVNFDIVSNVTSGLLVKLLIVHGGQLLYQSTHLLTWLV